MSPNRRSNRSIHAQVCSAALLSCLLLSACGPQPAALAPDVLPTAAPAAATVLPPTPTPLPSPSPTSEPTLGPTPAPTLAPTPADRPAANRSLALLLGGPRNEWFASSLETADGGLLLAGATNSPKFGTELDAYLVRLDPKGRILWQKCYGGPVDDGATTVLELSDGDLLLLGYSVSFGKGAQDGWIVRLSPEGVVRWQKSYGGPGDDVIYAGLELPDGQIVAAGHTSSFGAGGYDAWVFRVTPAGETVWSKTYGGKDNDRASAIAATGDGWLIAGATNSFGAGDSDIYLAQLDAHGAAVWQKAIGGTGSDYASSILPAEKDRWLVSGSTTVPDSGSYDAWIGSFDAKGGLAWQRTYGGPADDFAEVLVPAPDGGFTFLGETHNAPQGGSDAWLVSANPDGKPRWQRAFGGKGDDSIDALTVLSGGYLLAGWTQSFNAQGPDAWALKLDSAGGAPECGSVTPLDLDSAGGHLADTLAEGGVTEAAASSADTRAQQHDAGLDDRALCAPAANAGVAPSTGLSPAWTLHFPKSDSFSSVVVRDTASLPDGGFLLAGEVTPGTKWPGKTDIWLARLNADGAELWQQVYGTPEGSETAAAVSLSRDGSFLVAGYSGAQRYLLLRVEENGKLQWSRSVPSQSAPTDAAVTETPAGEVLLAGSSMAYVYRLWSFSDSGKLNWRFGGRLESGDGDRWAFSSIALRPLPTGGFYLAGSAVSQNSGDNIFAVLGLDAFGNAVWQRGYRLSPAAVNKSIALEILPTGGFIAAGIQDDAQEGQPWVLRAGEDGTPQWAASLDLLDLSDVALMPDRLVLVGSGIQGAVAAALDLDGTPLWQTAFKSGPKSIDSAAAVAIAPDGGALLTGNSSTLGELGYTAFALRLDSEGRLEGCGGVQSIELAETPLEMGVRLYSGLTTGTSSLEEDVDETPLTVRAIANPSEPFCPAQ